MTRLRKIANSKAATTKRRGFAITLELLFTIAIFAMFTNATLYCLYAMNLQNTIYNIGTSTISEISRWGGTNTNSYRINSATFGYGNIVQRTDRDLRALSNDRIGLSSQVNARVVNAGPSKITRNNTNVYLSIKYSYPLPIMLGGDFMRNAATRSNTITFKIPSLTKPGSLL